MPKQSRKHQPRVSVIIPVYNCEKYLQRCLDSVFNQTFKDFEVVAVNDGSTDGSLEILRTNEIKHKELTVIDQTNHGQGYTRNRQLDMARSEYVLFIDSDDYIEPLTLELAVARADNDQSDLVHFDWKLSREASGQLSEVFYYNIEPFAHSHELTGAECDELLGGNTFYSVANLYRRSFLNVHNIRYDEGYIYEDVIFMVQVANRAQKVSLLHAPLYVVQRNLTSTTRSGTKTDKHYKHYLRAVKKSFDDLEPRLPQSTFYLAGYFLASFVAYYFKRVPMELRDNFLKEFVDLIGAVDINPVDSGHRRNLLKKMVELGIFKNQKYRLFWALIIFKTQLLPRQQKAILMAKKTKHYLMIADARRNALQIKRPIIKDSVVFLGFDHRYTGNSRYLYEQMINDSRFNDRHIKFITDNELVDAKNRVVPSSNESSKWAARAEVIIAESWVPDNIKKRPEATWIQLWHGVPLKKILFDSSETELMRRSEDHRVNKYKNVLKWDYLLVDSNANADKFASSLLFPRERMVYAGYPRVKYLLENIDNQKLKANIKKRLGFDDKLLNKKLILYAPTWRDYNYEQPNQKQDHSYLLDTTRLAEELGDNYLVLFHGHHFMPHQNELMNARCLDVSQYDIQDLLLVSDCLVTDYSSILFDAFPINLPVAIYATDFEKYNSSRGVYADMWHDLRPFFTTDPSKLSEMVTSYRINDSYKNFRAKYCYDEQESLIDRLANLKSHKSS